MVKILSLSDQFGKTAKNKSYAEVKKKITFPISLSMVLQTITLFTNHFYFLREIQESSLLAFF